MVAHVGGGGPTSPFAALGRAGRRAGRGLLKGARSSNFTFTASAPADEVATQPPPSTTTSFSSRHHLPFRKKKKKNMRKEEDAATCPHRVVRGIGGGKKAGEIAEQLRMHRQLQLHFKMQQEEGGGGGGGELVIGAAPDPLLSGGPSDPLSAGASEPHYSNNQEQEQRQENQEQRDQDQQQQPQQHQHSKLIVQPLDDDYITQRLRQYLIHQKEKQQEKREDYMKKKQRQQEKKLRRKQRKQEKKQQKQRERERRDQLAKERRRAEKSFQHGSADAYVGDDERRDDEDVSCETGPTRDTRDRVGDLLASPSPTFGGGDDSRNHHRRLRRRADVSTIHRTKKKTWHPATLLSRLLFNNGQCCDPMALSMSSSVYASSSSSSSSSSCGQVGTRGASLSSGGDGERSNVQDNATLGSYTVGSKTVGSTTIGSTTIATGGESLVAAARISDGTRGGVAVGIVGRGSSGSDDDGGTREDRGGDSIDSADAVRKAKTCSRRRSNNNITPVAGNKGGRGDSSIRLPGGGQEGEFGAATEGEVDTNASIRVDIGDSHVGTETVASAEASVEAVYAGCMGCGGSYARHQHSRNPCDSGDACDMDDNDNGNSVVVDDAGDGGSRGGGNCAGGPALNAAAAAATASVANVMSPLSSMLDVVPESGSAADDVNNDSCSVHEKVAEDVLADIGIADIVGSPRFGVGNRDGGGGGGGEDAIVMTSDSPDEATSGCCHQHCGGHMSAILSLVKNINSDGRCGCGRSDNVVCDDKTDLDELYNTVPEMLREIRHDGKSRHVSLQKLHMLTDRDHRRNRLPLICTTRFDVVSALLPCLSPTSHSQDRRKALLILANLSVPIENKAVMLLRPTTESAATATAVKESPTTNDGGRDGRRNGQYGDDNLLSALLRIIQLRLKNETYLAAACLYNLSYLDDAKAMMVLWEVPSNSCDSGRRSSTTPAVAASHSVKDDTLSTNTKSSKPSTIGGSNRGSIDEKVSIPPNSCLAILESLIVEYAPYLMTSVTTNEEEHAATAKEIVSTRSISDSITNVIGGSSSSINDQNQRKPLVQGEAVRWCMGALRNLVAPPMTSSSGFVATSGSDNHEVARLVVRTRIPEVAAKLLASSHRDLGLWTARDSLEDSCLMLFVHLSSHCCSYSDTKDLATLPPAAIMMPSLDALKPALEKLKGQGGIHEVRAVALLRLLEEEEQQSQKNDNRDAKDAQSEKHQAQKDDDRHVMKNSQSEEHQSRKNDPRDVKDTQLEKHHGQKNDDRNVKDAQSEEQQGQKNNTRDVKGAQSEEQQGQMKVDVKDAQSRCSDTPSKTSSKKKNNYVFHRWSKAI